MALSCSSGSTSEDADEPSAGKPVTSPTAAESDRAAAAPTAAASAEAPACAAGLVAVSAADLGPSTRDRLGKTVSLRAAYRQTWVSKTGTGGAGSAATESASSGCAPGVATVGDDQHRVDITGEVLCSVRLVEGTEYVFTGTFKGPVEFPAPGGGSTAVAAASICKP
jgi:hypothetical protein